jgi:hypothetical protein
MERQMKCKYADTHRPPAEGNFCDETSHSTGVRQTNLTAWHTHTPSADGHGNGQKSYFSTSCGSRISH